MNMFAMSSAAKRRLVKAVVFTMVMLLALLSQTVVAYA